MDIKTLVEEYTSSKAILWKEITTFQEELVKITQEVDNNLEDEFLDYSSLGNIDYGYNLVGVWLQQESKCLYTEWHYSEPYEDHEDTQYWNIPVEWFDMSKDSLRGMVVQNCKLSQQISQAHEENTMRDLAERLGYKLTKEK